MNDNTKKLIKYLIKTGVIAGVAVAAYSPGLIALSLFDASIFRAGMSIITGVALTAGFGISTAQYFLPEKTHIKLLTTKIDVTALSEKLRAHEEDAYMGKLAAQALTQVDRLNKSIERAEFEIARKFDKSTITYQNFYSSVTAASNCAFENLNSFSNRLQLYSDEEYINLQHYKEDDIPDDIQEQQIEIIEKNLKLGKDALAANEQLILGLDKLAMELADSNVKSSEEENSELLNNIKELTNTVKYYI